MIERHDSVIVTTFARFTVPLGQLFGFYVLAHGHYSPGGGFQAGVILAASWMLLALSFGREAIAGLDEARLLALGAAGVMIFLLTGALSLPGGAVFLDYAGLPLAAPPARLRYLGILFVEIGVTLAVAATLLVLFCRLADRDQA